MHTKIVIAPDTALYENCPALSKVEAAIVQQGTDVLIQWEIRQQNGEPLNLNAFIGEHHCHCDDLPEYNDVPEESIEEIEEELLESLDKGCLKPQTPQRCQLPVYVEVRIQTADEASSPLWIAPAKILDPATGSVRFPLPQPVSNMGGLFCLSIGLCRKNDQNPLYIHKGLLSVERSAWHNGHACHTPTLTDIRMRIMDTDTENLLQGYTEFSNADILDSIVSAVREWNGTTPHLARYTYTCSTFPWIEPWINKIIASLYNKAALRYRRNKLKMSIEGAAGDDLARDVEYLQTAAQYEQQWKQWLTVKKKELNLNGMFGVVSSPYHRTLNHY